MRNDKYIMMKKLLCHLFKTLKTLFCINAYLNVLRTVSAVNVLDPYFKLLVQQRGVCSVTEDSTKVHVIQFWTLSTFIP